MFLFFYFRSISQAKLLYFPPKQKNQIKSILFHRNNNGPSPSHKFIRSEEKRTTKQLFNITRLFLIKKIQYCSGLSIICMSKGVEKWPELLSKDHQSEQNYYYIYCIFTVQNWIAFIFLFYEMKVVVWRHGGNRQLQLDWTHFLCADGKKYIFVGFDDNRPDMRKFYLDDLFSVLLFWYLSNQI